MPNRFRPVLAVLLFAFLATSASAQKMYWVDEGSFDDLRARITRTRAFMDELTPAQIDAGERRTIEQPTRIGTLTFSGPDFLLHFALPQLMFHVTTAYGIIRHAGVEIGKVDFMGSAVR